MANESEPKPATNCSKCGNPLIPEASVCYQCGTPVIPEEDWEGAYISYRNKVILFFSINLAVCLIFNFWPPASESLTGLIIVDSFLFLCAIYFAWEMRSELKPLLRWNKLSWWRILTVVLAAVASAVVVNYGVKWINRSVFDREMYYYAAFRDLPFPKISMLLLIAFLPALSEELAYRGVIQSGLLKIMDGRQAVVITALLFSIIHLSLISFVWLLPFALFLGWVRQRTNTIWYGVVIHFFFNATTCYLELFELGLL